MVEYICTKCLNGDAHNHWNLRKRMRRIRLTKFRSKDLRVIELSAEHFSSSGHMAEIAKNDETDIENQIK